MSIIHVKCFVVKRSKKNLDEAKTKNDEAQRRLREIRKRVTSRITSAAQFQEYADACCKPGLDYFRTKFTEDNAPLKVSMDIYLAGTVCNPTKLKNMTLEQARVNYMFVMHIMLLLLLIRWIILIVHTYIP